jgi:nucleotide-binding universal stress UspA family protein
LCFAQIPQQDNKISILENNIMSKPGERKQESVVVAIDKDKGSQAALKWAVESLLGKGKTVTLLHIRTKASPNSNVPLDSQAKELFLPFRCFCHRKDIQVNEVVVEDTDVAKGICEYARANFIESVVVGAPVRNAFVRTFKSVDIPGQVTKGVPEFSSVYVISKGKVSTIKSATIPVPIPKDIQTARETPRSTQNTHYAPSSLNEARYMQNGTRAGSLERQLFGAKSNSPDDMDSIKSPFMRGNTASRLYGELSMPDTDISFVSSSRPSTERLNSMLDSDMGLPPRLSNSSDPDSRISFGSTYSNNSFGIFSSSSAESGGQSWSSQSMEDVEAEMRRLKQELKQTMDMYSTACKEALTAKQTALELHRWKVEEQQRLEEARQAEEAARAIAEREKERCKAAIEKAEAAQRLAEHEAQRRIDAERRALVESEQTKKMMDKLVQNDVRYRRYTIEEIEAATEYFSDSRKIGEGGYGPVYKCILDHTEVAVKVLRPDAAQGRSQFQQEVEVLSCIRHPNMVLLLGACPEYGCLVYEYMANGSLDDRLFRRGNTPVLPWQVRFRIAAEIGTGLRFIHQTKPEPLVHRDLKPGNILLDRNLVSKISDVGLARLVPPSVADSVTQYLMTSTAGTFCYIDPEYQQTGMLGTKSDVYSLGVVLLQIITAKPPMGLTHLVARSIERGTFAEILDPTVPDWPIEEALSYAKLALQCTELRRKDRPDLGEVLLPELERLRAFAEKSVANFSLFAGPLASGKSSHSQVS